MKEEKITLERPIDGKFIFQSDCASCHHPLKDGTGPALQNIINKHNSEWLHNFFANRHLLKRDAAYQRIIGNDIKPDCFEFSDMTLAEIKALKSYLVGCNRGCLFE